MRVLYWGTYDTGKPRNRILLHGLREAGVEVAEIHHDVWGGVEDKSQLRNLPIKILYFIKTALAYPILIWRFLREKHIDVVVVGYLGQLDVIVIRPFAKLRGIPVCWDVFISLYDTVVADRCLLARRNPLAWMLYGWEWLASRCCDLVVMDTKAHCAYFAQLYRLDPGKTAAIPVGAEPEHFPPSTQQPPKDTAFSNERPLRVLFYGQFIPLHGIETIVEAARQLADEPIEWTIIGTGQEQTKIDAILHHHRLERVHRILWVAYDQLHEHIDRADICLGIFGTSGKAGRVIPNKVFQGLMVGKPLITRDSAAIRELVDEKMRGVYLVPAGDAPALARAISMAYLLPKPLVEPAEMVIIQRRIAPRAIGNNFKEILDGLMSRR
ncbi:MAG: glycosyltransferase [Desulfofustis sp. PB-SRB1]|jgi:glycosyltransferase involved in cell wall biosynthesis|nr:glycosyltransferase [Desulfofustis sp. PB-SRB1]MBM1001660.1 glycosyltransferase [Desulfofustis sp. PB-SRB1]HBH32943.1 hypothetical protein [Desulfofustis sp.]